MLKETKKSLIIITGCDSGIGLELAKLLAEQGYRVLASWLDSDPFGNRENIISHKLDLRNESEIIAFASKAEKLCDEGYTLKYLVNNAATALGGPVENIPLDFYREVFEVNFFGYISLTQRLIPLLKKDRGNLLIHGSAAGRIAMPFLSPYAASKFALEGFTDSIRRELRAFGIKVVLLETGGVDTPIWKRVKNVDFSIFDNIYKPALDNFVTNFIEKSNSAMPAKKCAEEILHILMKKRPRSRYIVGGNKMILSLAMHLSDRLLDWILRI